MVKLKLEFAPNEAKCRGAGSGVWAGIKGETKSRRTKPMLVSREFADSRRPHESCRTKLEFQSVRDMPPANRTFDGTLQADSTVMLKCAERSQSRGAASLKLGRSNHLPRGDTNFTKRSQMREQ
jgi:hypothetical protein